MADALDQSEIDALLAAVEDPAAGEAGTTGSGEGQVFSRSGRSAADLEVRDYDFKRPERVSKDQMRAFEMLHESFARSFGAAMSGFLRTILEVKVANIEQMTFSEFTHSLPNPTCFSLISPDPLEGSLCLEISPLIVYPVIDRLLGGSNADLFIPQRPLTPIELRLVSKILDRAMSAMKEAWENIIQANFSLIDTESNPALVQIVPPNEVVIVISFELKMSGRAGTMALCIPYNVIEPVVDKVSSQTWSAYARTTRNQRLRDRLADHLEQAPLGVHTTLARTTIKLSELMDLQAGDVLMTEKPAASPLTLHVGGQRKFLGQLGQHLGNRAFTVSRTASARDRV